MSVKQPEEGTISALPKRIKPPGALPGTIMVYPDAPPSVISIVAFGPDGFVEEQVEGAYRIAEYLNEWPVVWINVDGLGDKDVIQQLGTMFELHRLALEDVVSVHQRPKIEQYDNQLFFVARMVYQSDQVETEQL